MTKPKTNTTIGGKNYYRIRRTIDGETKTFYGRSKTDAEQKYKDYIEGKSRDAPVANENYSEKAFRSMARDYIKTVLMPSQKYATATKERYSTAYKAHIAGTWLDKMRLHEIRASDIQRFYNELPVSKQTLATVNKFMRGFNRWLVMNEYAKDFISPVEIPRKPENKRHDGIVVWSDEEIQTILDNIQGHRLCFFIYILLYTGARISEAIALEHSDICDGVVHIKRQCYCGELKPPKYHSVREVPIHEELWIAYQKHIEWQKQDMEKYGYETNLLFTTSTGNMYDPKSIRKSLKKFYDSHGMSYKSPHAYRATFCTQMCRCGIPIQVASSLMGHKSIEVTASHYTRVQRDSKEDAIARLCFQSG